MATNQPALYGRDIRCVRDATELWSEAEGIEVVRQDTIHLITCEDFLGPGGDRLGINLFACVGGDTEQAKRMALLCSQVIQDADPRIDSADVQLNPVRHGNGLEDLYVSIRCDTALGPFDIVGNLSEIKNGVMQ